MHPERGRNVDALCAAGSNCPDTASVTYLGADGFLIRHGPSSVLTPPLFTRRGILATALGLTYRTDTARIDRALAEMRVRLDDVSTVVVGHSHYDHLIDIPYIARKHLPSEARIIGTPSMGHILAADAGARRRTVVLPRADIGDGLRAGRWVYAPDGRSRVMAFASKHPDNVWFFTFAPGRVTRDRTTLPRSAWGWKLGETYAYLIDFIRADSTPIFRVFYHDAPFIPAPGTLDHLAPRDARPVDVAIICAGNFDKLDGYPHDAIANLRARRVIVGHWDDFFDQWTMDPGVLPLNDTRELAKRLDRSAPGRWITPFPGSVLRFAF